MGKRESALGNERGDVARVVAGWMAVGDER